MNTLSKTILEHTFTARVSTDGLTVEADGPFCLLYRSKVGQPVYSNLLEESDGSPVKLYVEMQELALDVCLQNGQKIQQPQLLAAYAVRCLDKGARLDDAVMQAFVDCGWAEDLLTGQFKKKAAYKKSTLVAEVRAKAMYTRALRLLPSV